MFRWMLMWAIACSMYFILKCLSWFVDAPWAAPLWKHVAYLMAWPGMDARAFFCAAPPDSPAPREWIAATAKCALGVTLIHAGIIENDSLSRMLVGWMEMIGLVLFLHCGLFHLLSCLWRSMGVRAERIMNAPLLTTGVSEFWGRRWNRPFRDLTYRFLFRPLSARYGAAIALWAGFLISGIVHELAITVPAQNGYGGPTVYFLVQAAGLSFERSTWGRRLDLGRGWMGWIFAAAVIIGPVALLFPPPFVCDIIIPFCRDLGRLL